MTRGDDGVWVTDENDPRLADFAAFDHKPYMYRITKDDGTVAYKSDLYSRCQVGSGMFDPKGQPFADLTRKLDGPGSCSAVVDSDQVTAFFEDPQGRWPESDWVQAEEFWKDEKDLIGTAKPVPRRVDDLVIYELHVGALGGPEKQGPGTLKDAIELLDYLVDLGVNAVELLPMSQFSGEENWGYGTSHYYAIEYSGGGRDQYKYFIKACHRRGIAVIFDVVYNHFTPNAEPGRVGIRHQRRREEPVLLVRGRPLRLPRLPAGGRQRRQGSRRLHRQHVDGLRPPLLRGDGTEDVHQQRRHADGGVPHRRVPRRPDHVDPLLQRTPRRRPARAQRQPLRRQVPPRVDEHPAVD